MGGAASLDDCGFVVVRSAVPTRLCADVRESLTRWARSGAPGDGRIQDAWRRHRSVRRLACHPEILSVLGELYGRRPIPFQTLNFAHGTQQPLHADSVHFDSIPTGWMCGVWVALEDVGADQGPLVVVPGSHRTTRAVFERTRGPGSFDMAGYEEALATGLAQYPREEFHATAGDALIWHADLAHGGAPVRDPAATRWSQVTHYFFEGFTYVTPMLADASTGEVYLREPLVDISTNTVAEHRLSGGRARYVRVAGGRTRLIGDEEPPPGVSRAIASSLRGVWRHSKVVLNGRLNWRHGRSESTGFG